MKVIFYFSVGLIILILAGCGQNSSDEGRTELNISAASSLTAPLNEIKTLYEEQQTDIELVINYGSSGTLVNQLDQGAPADLVILANTSWMDRAVAEGIVNQENITNILTNRLVLAVHQESTITSFESLEKEADKVAIGDPASVPAGSYAKQALTQLNIWGKLEDRLVLAKSARQVATYIESKNAEAGFVFQSDAESFSSLKTVEVLPEDSHNPIVYPAAAVTESEEQEAAEEFLSFLVEKEAMNIFQNYGFQEAR